jgi:hypothetical protein
MLHVPFVFIMPFFYNYVNILFTFPLTGRNGWFILTFTGTITHTHHPAVKRVLFFYKKVDASDWRKAMLINSQPIDPKFYEKLGLNKSDDFRNSDKNEIKSQHIGKMFDDFFDDSRKQKIDLMTRLRWKKRRMKDKALDVKHTIRNHFKWHKTMKSLRSWEGFSGLIRVMQTHLSDYIDTESKYGHSLEEYKNQKIATVKETLEILERMKEPDEYISKCHDEVKIKYPNYDYLVSKYENGDTGFSGKFIAQGNGWAGRESGKNPRKGYFEFVNGRFELQDSPNQDETDRILA